MFKLQGWTGRVEKQKREYYKELLQLAGILNQKRNEQLFIERLLELCIRTGTQMPQLLPGQKDFEEKAIEVLTEMMGVNGNTII